MKKFQNLIKSSKFILFVVLFIALMAGIFSYYFSMNGVMPQNTIYFINETQLPKVGQNVLIFSPHPDDESIGSAGFIMNSIKNGANVKIVLVTDGNKHGLRDRRYSEFKKATSELGVKETDLVFLNYPDGKLDKINQDELTASLKEQIDDFNPNYIVYPSVLDTHPDHRIIGNDIKRLINGNTNIVSYQYLVHYHDYPKPKMYRSNLYLLPPLNSVSFSDEWFKLSLSSEEENRKYQALLSYKTQLRVPILKSLIMSSIRKNELFSKEKLL